jgi:hypothetical protein
VKEGVPTAVADTSVDTPLPLLLGRLTDKLINDLYLSHDVAKWAVEAWAEALGRFEHCTVNEDVSVKGRSLYTHGRHQVEEAQSKGSSDDLDFRNASSSNWRLTSAIKLSATGAVSKQEVICIEERLLQAVADMRKLGWDVEPPSSLAILEGRRDFGWNDQSAAWIGQHADHGSVEAMLLSKHRRSHESGMQLQVQGTVSAQDVRCIEERLLQAVEGMRQLGWDVELPSSLAILGGRRDSGWNDRSTAWIGQFADDGSIESMLRCHSKRI